MLEDAKIIIASPVEQRSNMCLYPFLLKFHWRFADGNRHSILRLYFYSHSLHITKGRHNHGSPVGVDIAGATKTHGSSWYECIAVRIHSEWIAHVGVEHAIHRDCLVGKIKGDVHGAGCQGVTVDVQKISSEWVYLPDLVQYSSLELHHLLLIE